MIKIEINLENYHLTQIKLSLLERKERLEKESIDSEFAMAIITQIEDIDYVIDALNKYKID